MKCEQRPNAALINREWFEAAAKALQRDDLCDVLFSAVTYVIYGDMPEGLSQAAEIVFTMIRPALDSDLDKYRERCERNAANAKSGRQRVAASGSEWQRVGATTTPTPTTTPNTTPTQNESISCEEKEKEEKFLVYGYFFSTGSNAVAQECSAFWNYYEALGWKNNKGAAIVNKLSAARMWKRQYDTKQPPIGAREWFDTMRRCSIKDYRIWDCYAGAERVGDEIKIHMHAPEEWRNQFQEVAAVLLASLRKQWGADQLSVCY